MVAVHIGSLRVGSLVIDPPLVNGSGAIDVVSPDPEWVAEPGPLQVLGAYVTKTVTAAPRAGHARPRVELVGEGSLVNAVGLENPGIDAVVAGAWDTLPDLLGIPVIMSIGGSVDELAAMSSRIEAELSWVGAVEVNLSCPNLGGGHHMQAGDPGAAAAAVSAVRAATTLPVLAKLSAAADVRAVTAAVDAAGADGLVVCNTMPARMLDEVGDAVLGVADGGLSGVALHVIALRAVADARSVTGLPIIGLGGVDGDAGVRRMLASGASAIGVGTAGAIFPGVLATIADSLRGPH